MTTNPARERRIGVTGPLVLVLVLALVAACSGGDSGGDSGKKQTTSKRCPVSDTLVPSCGALWGFAPGGPKSDQLIAAEKVLGRRFDFVYRFHDINDEIPDAQERQLSEDGTLLHLSIDPRDFAVADRSTVSWRAVAGGAFDDSLRRQAEGLAALDVPAFVTFDHEVDQPAKEALGSPEDFKAAWRHVHDLFEEAGATKAVWVWVVLGGAATFERAGSLWPGNDVVDWISWDVYNASGCRAGTVDPGKYQTFAQVMLPFYRWLHATGPDFGIDPEKPLMISETGSVIYDDDPAKAAQFYAQIPAVLRKYPQIKAVGLWNQLGNGVCDYRFMQNDVVSAALREASQDPWVSAQTRPLP